MRCADGLHPVSLSPPRVFRQRSRACISFDRSPRCPVAQPRLASPGDRRHTPIGKRQLYTSYCKLVLVSVSMHTRLVSLLLPPPLFSNSVWTSLLIVFVFFFLRWCRFPAHERKDSAARRANIKYNALVSIKLFPSILEDDRSIGKTSRTVDCCAVRPSWLFSDFPTKDPILFEISGKVFSVSLGCCSSPDRRGAAVARFCRVRDFFLLLLLLSILQH